jgi:ATP-binding cassette, subfamily B, bacterial PglK
MLQEVARRFGALDRAQRVRWGAMPAVGLLTALLEALGGAIVFALIALLVAPESAGSGRLVRFLTTALPGAGGEAPLLPLAIWAAAIHIVKTALVAGAAWWRARLVARGAAELSARLLRACLAAPWPFHLRRSSATMLERLRDSPRSYFDVLDGASVIVAETALIAGLVVVALVAAPPALTLLMAGLGIVAALVLRATRRRQLRGGARATEFGTSLYRHIQHALGAVKEVTLLGRGAHFADAYAEEACAAAALESRRAVYDALPRLVVESAFILGMLLLVVISGLTGGAASVLPLAGLFAYAGFRIAPAANRIAVQAGSLRWAIGASAALLDDLETLAPASAAHSHRDAEPPRLGFREALNVEGVTFTYEGASRPVLDRVTLTLRRGESLAIAGATGAGKTTLVDVIVGLLTPSAGEVTVDGQPISANLPGWQANIGYVPQHPFLLDDTIRRNIALGIGDAEIDEGAIRRALALARLDRFVDSLPDGLDTVVGEQGVRLSGGERQRIAIARALYRDPALVVFDEATSALDPGTEREIADAIDALRGDRTIVVVAHRLSTVQRCDRVILLHDGRVEADGPWTALAHGSAAFRAVAAL